MCFFREQKEMSLLSGTIFISARKYNNVQLSPLCHRQSYCTIDIMSFRMQSRGQLMFSWIHFDRTMIDGHFYFLLQSRHQNETDEGNSWCQIGCNSPLVFDAATTGIECLLCSVQKRDFTALEDMHVFLSTTIDLPLSKLTAAHASSSELAKPVNQHAASGSTIKEPPVPLPIPIIP